MANFVELKAILDEKVNSLNNAIKADKPASELAVLEEEVKTALKNANKQRVIEIMTAFRNTDEPLKAFIKNPFYMKLVKTIGKDTGLVSIDETSKMMSLKEFVDFCKPTTIVADVTWYGAIENFALLLAMRNSKALKITEEEMKKLNAQFRLSKKADRTIAPNLMSKSTGVAELQSLVDKIIFEADAKGKNALIKITNCDVAKVELESARSGKNPLNTKLAAVKDVLALVTIVLHVRMNNLSYGVEYPGMDK